MSSLNAISLSFVVLWLNAEFSYLVSSRSMSFVLLLEFLIETDLISFMSIIPFSILSLFWFKIFMIRSIPGVCPSIGLMKQSIVSSSFELNQTSWKSFLLSAIIHFPCSSGINGSLKSLACINFPIRGLKVLMSFSIKSIAVFDSNPSFLKIRTIVVRYL